MKLILSTIVGSRLHGTHGPDSDTDYRGVFILPLKEKLSPFTQPKESHWIEGVGDADDTAYELGKFCKMAATGNPSCLEVLVGIPHTTTSLGDKLKELLPEFLSIECIESFRGYARNQEKKFRSNDLDRKYKYATAHIRTLHQLHILLVNGVLVGTYPEEITVDLRAIKNGEWSDAEIMAEIIRLEEMCDTEAKRPALQHAPNRPLIEQFVRDAYHTFG